MANNFGGHMTHHGYKVNILIGQSQPDTKFLCHLCGFLLKKPVQNMCGHRFCSECLKEVTSENEDLICPVCEEEDIEIEDESLLSIEKAYSDVALMRDMANLKVRCPHEDCQWTGKFSDMQKHEDVCPKKSCSNPQCNGSHPQSSCPQSVAQCPLCQKQVTLNELEMKHPAECPKAQVNCEICKAEIIRENLSRHFEESGKCGKVLKICEFGCPNPIEKTMYDKHKNDKAVHHLEKVRVTLDELVGNHDQGPREIPLDIRNRFEVMERTTGNLNSKIHDLQSKVQQLDVIVGRNSSTSSFSMPGAEGGREINSLASFVSEVGTEQRGLDDVDGHAVAIPPQHHDVTSLETLKTSLQVIDNKVSTFEGIIAVLRNEVEQCSKHLEVHERDRRRDRERLDVQERTIKALERASALKDVALAEQDLRIQALEMASYDGTLIWKIEKFARRREEATRGRVTSIYSPCFYTSRSGYKLCCRLYLNGDGMGKGSHISLFFVVMRGQNDALLRWPFQQKVTFMLLDQNNKNHTIDAFRPDPTSSSFRRPVSEMNIASGCPLFFPLSQLNESKFAYVKDDTMFIRIVVDCSDL